LLRAELALGNSEEAGRRFAEIAGAGFDRLPRNIRWVSTLLELAHLCADLGDRDHAAPLEVLLAPYAHLHGVLPVPICYGGPVEAGLARLAALQGRRDEARERLDDAIAAADRLGAKPTAARLRAFRF
jgi:hypothetical protein